MFSLSLAALCLCRKGFTNGTKAMVYVDKVMVHVVNIQPALPRHLSAFSFKAVWLPLSTNAPKSMFVFYWEVNLLKDKSR